MVTITDIINAYGAYYLKNGQNKSRLLGVPTIPCETLAIPGMRHIKTDETIYQLANPIFSKVLQQYQKAFTAKGGTKFHPNQIQLRQLKVDDELYPHDIEESWLGFLAGDSSRKIEDWPIVRWLLEEYYAKQIAQDKELDVVYKGVYEAPSTGVAGSSSKCFDGFRKKLIDGYNDNDYPINVIDGIGPLEKTAAFDQIEKFSEMIASQFNNANVIIFCAPEFERAYRKGKRNAQLYDATSDSQFGTRIDFSNHILKGVQSMTGTTDIFASLPENMIHIKKRNENLTNIDMQKADRLVKLLMDWWEAVGFGVNSLVWATRETVQEEVKNPVISNNGNAVTMTCETAGATIYFTTDGSKPNAESNVYSGTITIDATTTFKAIAVKNGMDDSNVVTKKVNHV